MSEISCSLTPDSGGNMYFRGRWEYCPEYRIGDVVIHNGELYMCVKEHAGHDPSGNDGGTYWASFGALKEETSTVKRMVLDGGYASTLAETDVFATTTLAEEINGGLASERVHVPLV